MVGDSMQVLEVDAKLDDSCTVRGYVATEPRFSSRTGRKRDEVTPLARHLVCGRAPL